MTESFPSASDPLAAATQLVKTGRLDQAKEVLTKYLMQNPASEQGWLLMSFVLSDAAQQKDCLERVLRINPSNTVAQSRLAHLMGKRTEELFHGKGAPPAPPATRPEPFAERHPVQPALSVLPSSETGAKSSHPAEPPSSSAVESELSAAPGRKFTFSGKWFWMISIILAAIIVGTIGVLLYVGVIAPAISHLSGTSTPTTQAVIVPTLPPVWTNTLTPTTTPTAAATFTPTVTITPSITATASKSRTPTKKP
jgi:hypothetical protein